MNTKEGCTCSAALRRQQAMSALEHHILMLTRQSSEAWSSFDCLTKASHRYIHAWHTCLACHLYRQCMPGMPGMYVPVRSFAQTFLALIHGSQKLYTYQGQTSCWQIERPGREMTHVMSQCTSMFWLVPHKMALVPSKARHRGMPAF